MLFAETWDIADPKISLLAPREYFDSCMSSQDGRCEVDDQVQEAGTFIDSPRYAEDDEALSLTNLITESH